MDGIPLLRQARSAGLTVLAQGDKLVVRGPRRAGPLVEQLLAHKAEILDALFLETINPADLPADWHLFWDERAAIVEYDGGLQDSPARSIAGL